MDPAFAGDMSRDILILVIGDSGSGKGYLINRLLSAMGIDKRVSEGDTHGDATLSIEPVVIGERYCTWIKPYLFSSTKLNPTRFILVDTPGLNADPHISMVKRITDWVNASYRSPKLTSFQMLIGGVIYVHDISLDVIPRTTFQNLLYLQNRLPGNLPWSAVVLLSTKWAREVAGDFREKEPNLIKNHWSKLSPGMDKGAKVVRFAAGSSNEEQKSALEALHPIMVRHNQWWADILTRQFRFRQRFLAAGRLKTEEFTQNYRDAVEEAIRMHRLIADAQEELEEEKMTEADREQLAKDWKDTLEKLKGFDDQVSFWNILSFAIRVVPPLLAKMSVTQREE